LKSPRFNVGLLLTALAVAYPTAVCGLRHSEEPASSSFQRGTPKFAEPITLGPTDVAEWAVATKKVPPNFSTKLKRSCGEGSAHVRGVVGRDGKVSQVTLISATCSGFGDETTRTFRKWRFKPATVNGRAVATYFELTLNFRFEP
jgi:TonB family protein